MINGEGLFKDRGLSDKERKNLEILELIRKKSPVSKAEISKVTGLNVVTVSNYVSRFIKEGLLKEGGYDASTGGRKPVLVELNARGAFCIGVDIGPLHIIGALTDLKTTLLEKVKMDRPKDRMEAVIQTSANVVRELLEKTGAERKKVKAIGLGISGVIDELAGTIRDTDPLRGRTVGSFTAIRRKLEEEFGLPTYVGNDATVGAFGEKRLGEGSDVENLLYIYADVGCGIIINGEIYCGSGGSAGEIQLSLQTPEEADKMDFWSAGHAIMQPWGVDLGIVREARNIIRRGVGTKIIEYIDGDVEKVDLEKVIEAAREHDEVAVKIIEKAGRNLGIRVAFLINIFNPDLVIIGGGVERAGELILDSIRQTVRQLAFQEPAARVKIMASQLGENAVALGAAALVIREIFINA